MNKKIKLFGLFALVLFGALSFTACSDDDNNNNIDNSGPMLLSDVNWVTTQVTDEQGNQLELTDPLASPYVGYAFYKVNGDFRIVSMTGNTRLFGKWSVIENGTVRRLVAYNSFNEQTFTRDVKILKLDRSEFTYRINYDAQDTTKYLDVVHIPTDYTEPATPARILASTDWATTNTYDITEFYTGEVGSTQANNPINPALINREALDAAIANNSLVALPADAAPASNYSGDAYYNGSDDQVDSYFGTAIVNGTEVFSNGSFRITPYNDTETIRSEGNWYVSLDGRYRTLNATSPNVWTRVVYIEELNPTKFTYIIVDADKVLYVEHVSK